MNKKRGAFFYLQRCEFQVVHGNNFVLRVSQMAADAIGWFLELRYANPNLKV